MDLTIAYEENGYDFVETSDDLKDAAGVLPCFWALQWPNYATNVIEANIDGKDVVIQLWKGWCQQFLSSPEFPGGIGAEVGIYERVSGRGFPADRPEWMPVVLFEFLQAKSKLANGDFWWPVEEKHSVEFELINPVTNQTFFKAGPQNTYWRNKWMDTDSYDKYQNKQEKRWQWLPGWFPGNSLTPPFSSWYLLDYKINGVPFERW